MSVETVNALDAVPWSRLLRDIRNRQVLPIVGPGLVTVEDGRGGEVPYVRALAPRLAARLGVDGVETGSLNRVAGAHLMRRGKRKDIYEELRELVELDERLPVPAGLAELAAIRDFDLFVTSSFDPFVARALRQCRPGYKADAKGLAAFHPSRRV